MHRILLCTLLALPALAAGDPPKPPLDCMSQAIQDKNTTQFFVCLNLRRENCEELFRKICAECGPTTPKYRIACERYADARGKANLFLDLVSSDLRYGRSTQADAYQRYMKELSDAVNAFEAVDKRFACDGSQQKFLVILIPIITSVLSGKFTQVLNDWMSGSKTEKEAKAQMLTGQRWKPQSELGIAYPSAPPAT